MAQLPLYIGYNLLARADYEQLFHDVQQIQGSILSASSHISGGNVG